MYHASRAPAVEPSVAAGIVLAAVASYLVAAVVTPAPLRFVVAQLALVVVAGVGATIAHPARRLAALGLRGARLRFFAAGIAVGATAWYVNATVTDWLFAKLALPKDQAIHLQGLVDRPPLWQALAMFALVPAVCEEIVFRGVLARSIGRRLPLLAAAAISAVVFSAYHLSWVQALPTLTLGLALAVIAIRADSVAPAILGHAINNAMAIAVSRGALPELAGWFGHHPVAAVTGCAAVTAGGIVIAARGPA
ncbi:MAG TPA: type II CAAX endopeptidase family protein [Kofleriaceae bacterium]|nr:type II CAAX endopeptidase family protein [Kofleriaceae bacterium]